MLRVQMLNEHKCHASVGGQMLEKFREGFETAGIRAHTDDGEAL